MKIDHVPPFVPTIHDNNLNNYTYQAANMMVYLVGLLYIFNLIMKWLYKSYVLDTSTLYPRRQHHYHDHNSNNPKSNPNISFNTSYNSSNDNLFKNLSIVRSSDKIYPGRLCKLYIYYFSFT